MGVLPQHIKIESEGGSMLKRAKIRNRGVALASACALVVGIIGVGAPPPETAIETRERTAVRRNSIASTSPCIMAARAPNGNGAVQSADPTPRYGRHGERLSILGSSTPCPEMKALSITYSLFPGLWRSHFAPYGHESTTATSRLVGLI